VAEPVTWAEIEASDAFLHDFRSVCLRARALDDQGQAADTEQRRCVLAALSVSPEASAAIEAAMLERYGRQPSIIEERESERG
jgi:DNA-binding MurR/RpiR family transcriptional regulator